jgi:hypothetical protein
VRQLIELEKVHSDIGTCPKRGQDVGDKPPSRPHELDLGRRSILDHPEILPYATTGLRKLDPMVYPACSRCTWHARRVQREHPTQRGMLTPTR